MGFLDPNATQFTGTVGDFTYYRLPGIDRIIVRRKGGVSKKRIKKAPEFERTRQNNVEFSGCAKLAAYIHDQLHPVARLADYNVFPPLTAIMKKIQLKCDTGNRGERNIRISRYRFLLEGFQLNRVHPFGGIIRQPLHASINREQGTATIEVPPLIPGMNLFSPWKASYYRLVFSFGPIQDFMHDPQWDYQRCPYPRSRETKDTPWVHLTQPTDRQTITMQLPHAAAEDETLMLAIGIQMGSPEPDGGIWGNAKQGAGMVLRVG
ncbi:hypothetical protein EGT74_14145 [Chitinophaga lutea]|uniref:Uncharacterized protein n=1 Tax=Chitinophaga lutea TaxID=2488634 RepID=A0A3N4PT68_9BACT|nr:hypothetical protein [Chitinophaga lutea]RPE08201.1 hypothetical protein EGT74_14145 [Chitinophaga lutea]